MITRLLLLAASAVPAFAADAPARKILFFTKSSGYCLLYTSDAADE